MIRALRFRAMRRLPVSPSRGFENRSTLGTVSEQEKSVTRATIVWVVAGIVVCGGIGAVLGGLIGLIGLGAGSGLAIGAVAGFLIGMPAGDAK